MTYISGDMACSQIFLERTVGEFVETGLAFLKQSCAGFAD
jgi:hypothetical protein